MFDNVIEWGGGISTMDFEIVLNIMKYLHVIDALPKKLVCKYWCEVIDELFTFYPTSTHPYGFSIKNHFLVMEMGLEVGCRNNFSWRKMILNFLEHTVPKDCGVITVVLRVVENQECFTEKEGEDLVQEGFQTQVVKAANHYDARGYIQTISSYTTSGQCKRVFDVCCQGKPKILIDLIEFISTIQNETAAVLIDCNFISCSKISSKFVIKQTEVTNPVTGQRDIISLSHEGDLQVSNSCGESVFSINTFTISKANLANIKNVGMFEKMVLAFVIQRIDCPSFIVHVLSLFIHQEFRKPIATILSEMWLILYPILPLISPDNMESVEPFEPFWKEFKVKCSNFLQITPRARYIILCSSS